MVRPSTLKERFTTNVTFELKDYEDFEQLVGKGNISKELRAFIKERVNLQKNEQALDVLNLGSLKKQGLVKTTTPDRDNTRQSTLFETFAHRDRRDEISRFVNEIQDVTVLNTVETNCKAMLRISETRRGKIARYA